MQMMRGRSQGLAAMARVSLISSTGAPLLPPGCHRRHLLCLPDQMHKVWLPVSFRGARTSPGSDIAINGERLLRNALSHPLEEEMAHQMAFGFKEVNLDDARPLEMTERVDNFIEYTKFLVGGIKELHGAHVASTLPPVFKGLETMALDLLQNDQLLDLLLYYPALLPIHSKGLLYRRIYNLLA